MRACTQSVPLAAQNRTSRSRTVSSAAASLGILVGCFTASPRSSGRGAQRKDDAFKWTAKADTILEKNARVRQVLAGYQLISQNS
jgi:hypothetical protein